MKNLKNQLKIYLVGGAVRDLLLEKEPQDKDYVIVGATPEKILSTGDFKQVGKSFPVFIHEKTGDEYALARTEKKESSGHTGFSVDFNPSISLIEDLKRRDLTINSIALNEASGEFVDPFDGIKDLKNKVLKHTSEAFKEDPLRVLRVARFAAKMPDFKIHNSTLKLMKDLSSSDDFKTLTKERILQELKKALKTDCPSIFFKTLKEVDALDILEANCTFFCKINQREPNSFLVFLSNMALENLNSYNNFCNEFPLSVEELSVSSIIAEFHQTLKNPSHPEEVLRLFKRTNSLKEDKKLKKVLSVYSCIDPSCKRDLLLEINQSASIKFPALIKKYSGKTLGKMIKDERISIISKFL